jgi:pimeloyl-ACP methyl ester carboxylesterase
MFLLALLLTASLYAQDISGKWQGMLHRGQQDVRVILKIDKAADGALTGRFYQLGPWPDWGQFIPTGSVTLSGTDLKFTVPYYLNGTYEGKLSAEGNSISGIWTQAEPVALKFERPTSATEWKDPASHKVQFVTVDKDVKLEVLDFGGTGRPLVLLAGGGSTAHSFDTFAPKLTPTYHVYAITRRGFGDSSAPATGYEADRLGDDILAILDALKIQRPVLAGQSIAGEEMSSVGSRYPERVAGLIYLDAAYPYAYYNAERGDPDIDLIYLRNKLALLAPGNEPPDTRPIIRELLEKDLPQYEKDLRETQKDIEAWGPSGGQPRILPSLLLMFGGFQKYTKIPVPILAIYAVPHDLSVQMTKPKDEAALEARDLITTGAQADAFEKGVPTARVVRWPHAKHNLVRFHEADVLKEMNAFMAGLPK